MPRGVYERKARTTKTNKAEKIAAIKVSYGTETKETDAQIEARLDERFDVLEVLTEACTVGNARAVILSGPPGLGKSFTVERKLLEYDPSEAVYTQIKGYVRATGLIKSLYQYRHPGNIIVFDDADSIFADDVALNLLKAVCDTTDRRRVSWLSEATLVDEETGEAIPRSFDFEGSVIFITNLDFDYLIERKHKFAPHLEALMSRAHYLDLSLKTKRDYLIRIRQVIRKGMLANLTATEKADVIKFIEKHHESLRELSLRAAVKLGNLRKTNEKWERIARLTMCK